MGKYLIKELMQVNRGSSPRPIIEYLSDSGYRWLKISDFKMYDRYVYDTKEHIKESGLKNTRHLPAGTLILTNSATPGIPIFLGRDMCLHDGFLYFSNLKEDVIDINYLYYWFLYNRNLLVNQANGSVFQNLKKEIVENCEIEVPSIEIQKKIVNILDIINKKIELNNEINNNLSEQLKTVFYEWFESKMNDDLPDEWKIVELQEVSTFSQGVQVPIEEQIDQVKNGFVRFIRIVDITQGSEKEIRYIEDRDRGHVVENEIFMTRYGTPGIISRNYNGIIANNLFKISPSNEVTSNYLYSALNVDRIQSYIRGNATSSTMPAISFSTLNNQKIIIPDNKMLEKFDKYSETIRIKQLNIINENKKLEQLRDTLLPKLMNGEIDLDNIEI